MESRFLGRDILHRPQCPFCNQVVDPPQETGTGGLEMPLGKCVCGAVYACDVTGHNLGTALTEALLWCCSGDWARTWELRAGEDYNDELLGNYDLQTHLVVPGGNHEGRRIAGVLLFVLLKDPAATTPAAETRAEKPPRMTAATNARSTLSKERVETLVREYRLAELLRAAEGQTRILRYLQRLLYAVDPELRYRAADALGQVAARMAGEHSRNVTRLIQGLFTALTDTAASSWGYVDAIGEIIRNQPQRYGSYVARLMALSGDRRLLPEILRALGRIAAQGAFLVQPAAASIAALLNDSDPQVRGYAAFIFASLDHPEAGAKLQRLKDDKAPVLLYSRGHLTEHTVGEIAGLALQSTFPSTEAGA